jgi:hypothetical protein
VVPSYYSNIDRVQVKLFTLLMSRYFSLSMSGYILALYSMAKHPEYRRLRLLAFGEKIKHSNLVLSVPLNFSV